MSLLRQKSTGGKNSSMEGRRLPSLPADAILGVETEFEAEPEAISPSSSSPYEQYEKVTGAGTFC